MKQSEWAQFFKSIILSLGADSQIWPRDSTIYRCYAARVTTARAIWDQTDWQEPESNVDRELDRMIIWERIEGLIAGRRQKHSRSDIATSSTTLSANALQWTMPSKPYAVSVDSLLLRNAADQRDGRTLWMEGNVRPRRCGLIGPRRRREGKRAPRGSSPRKLRRKVGSQQPVGRLFPKHEADVGGEEARQALMFTLLSQSFGRRTRY